MVRRLKVLQTTAPEDAAAEERPLFQWVLIGAGLSATLWLPLVALAVPLGAHLVSAAFDLAPGAKVHEIAVLPPARRAGVALLTAGPVLVAFAAACLVSGLFVGRFSPSSQVKTAALGAATCSLAMWAVAAGSGALRPWPVAAFALAALALSGMASAALGAVKGRKRRSRA